MWSYLAAYPIATLSTAAFYVFLAVLAFPGTRAVVAPYFSHPIPPHQQYQLGFDTIRGFAAAFIAIGHFSYFTQPGFNSTSAILPFIGAAAKAVPIFCALSGFLIYRSVLGIGSLHDLRKYAIRRFFRIYPVYAAGVFLALAFSQFASPRAGTSPFAFFLSDLFMLTVLWSPNISNPVTWSLYIEVIFYLFLPVIVITIGQKRVLPFALCALLVMLAVNQPHRIVGLWVYFLFGILASEMAPKLRNWTWPLFILGVGLLLVDMCGSQFDWAVRLGIMNRMPARDTVGLGIACFLILATLPNLPSVGRLLNVLPLRLIGTISYSVFIIHPFYILANFPQIGIISQTKGVIGAPLMPAWYLPLIFFPGIFAWGLVAFLLVERPGIRFGASLIRKLTVNRTHGLNESSPDAHTRVAEFPLTPNRS